MRNKPATPTGAAIPPDGSPITHARVFFQRHWKRGAPGSPTPDWVTAFAYRTWLIALLFKMVGASWDMSWHFRWFRDDFAPPHLLNSVGTVMISCLVVIHTYTGLACDRRSLRLMQVGLVTFLVAAPLDVINHAVSGLDLTAWSPTHALLFVGTGIMILGAIDGWRKFAKPGRARTLTLGALWVFFLENIYFANGQQEYGILSVLAWMRGETEAEPYLLDFAARQIGRAVDLEAVIYFALPIDDWVYPVWGIGVMALVLAVARATTMTRFTATAVAGAYVAYRAAIWPLLVGAGFPPSTVPFYLLFVGIAVDAAFLLGRGRSLVTAGMGATLVTVIGFNALFLQSQLAPWLLENAETASAPPVNYWMAPVVAVGVAVAWAAASPVAQWWQRQPHRTAGEIVPDAMI
ncbi:MAG: hypothetical protein GEU86_03415 [Actinophytocola sp.]|nr:hypothetical protein [Actinophytocola sp.]